MTLSRRAMLGLGLAAVPAAACPSVKAGSGLAAQSSRMLDWASRMIAIPSYSHMSSKPMADFVESVMRELGFAIERIEYTDTRSDAKGVLKVNVVGRKGSGSGGFALSGHMDTVPAETWKDGSPFQPSIRNGRLFGRGACDMKGAIACMLEAAARLSSARLRRPVYLVFSSDEEIGGGAARVASGSQFFKEIAAQGVPMVIGEPTLMEVVYSHKSGWGFTATARGLAGHTSRDAGVNANLKLIPFLAEMKRMHDEVTTDPKWCNTEYDPPHIIWNIRIDDGTTPANIYPPVSRCRVSCRAVPKVDLKALADRVRSLADSMGLEIAVGDTSPVFFYVDPQSSYIRSLLEVNGKAKAVTAPYGSDAVTYFRAGARQLALSGPGNIDQAHTDDEWIELAQLDAAADAYAGMIGRYCL